MNRLIATLDPGRHVLIAGPTASGKSALALQIAEAQGGTVVNADALQVWSCWRVLTARPDPAETTRAPHALYGHVAPGRSYSVGEWLAEVAALPGRLIVTGGTGLYLNALTRGLAAIPPTPPEIRAQADLLNRSPEGLARMIAELDPRSRSRIDLKNPVRVQRAWEVLTATGRGIADWQAETPPPLIAPGAAHRLVLNPDRDRLADRIALRFQAMMDQGALDEVRRMLPQWDPGALWAKAIGAPELVAHLRGARSLEQAVQQAIVATRQYAKAQRSFFRGRMRDWDWIEAAPGAVT
ncbi:tRNA dimethylallyltransferase [Paracoccus aminovorans]|uniref:tRNA dimethylallyltransferase n=1 Tax=Paracoccus aminovorans TaxID=34004 RepID=A0A1I2Y9H9_9RHOB|nr:tRNA (adenosine(37)-N6)-dimethylallyltransferase MiaA [Paracoccus aminovorans]CQR86178.1 tRNA delta(2)-isopentenylpyrophosphate transferase [Paracoccus aminovorans]SFH22364.1 tRNA dimethylallyltransferase [Paracoccus aminovorans]